MDEDLELVAKDFSQYRKGKGKGRVRYPQSLWKRALLQCKKKKIREVALALGVHEDTLYGHLKRKKEGHLPFVPLNITKQAGIQLHIQTPIPVTIDFHRSTKELTQLLIDLQKGKAV